MLLKKDTQSSSQKCDIYGFKDNSDLDQKITTLATKAKLNSDLQAFDSSYFRGKSNFEDDGTHDYLVFQSLYKYFKAVANTNKVTLKKSRGFSDESIKPLLTSDNSLNTRINYISNA